MSTKWFLEFSINADGFARRSKIGQSTKKLKLFYFFSTFIFVFLTNSDMLITKKIVKKFWDHVRDLVESQSSVKPGKDRKEVNLELFCLDIQTG